MNTRPPEAVMQFEEVDKHFPSRTRIVCTIGKSSESVEALKDLLNSGMSIMRINMNY